VLISELDTGVYSMMVHKLSSLSWVLMIWFDRRAHRVRGEKDRKLGGLCSRRWKTARCFVKTR